MVLSFQVAKCAEKFINKSTGTIHILIKQIVSINNGELSKWAREYYKLMKFWNCHHIKLLFWLQSTGTADKYVHVSKTAFPELTICPTYPYRLEALQSNGIETRNLLRFGSNWISNNTNISAEQFYEEIVLNVEAKCGIYLFSIWFNCKFLARIALQTFKNPTTLRKVYQLIIACTVYSCNSG